MAMKFFIYIVVIMISVFLADVSMYYFRKYILKRNLGSLKDYLDGKLR